MAAFEVIRIWQGKQPKNDEINMRNQLREAFCHDDVGLRNDFDEGKFFLISFFFLVRKKKSHAHYH